MRQNEPWGAIAVPMESNSTQRGQALRMHGSALWKYQQKRKEHPPTCISLYIKVVHFTHNCTD